MVTRICMYVFKLNEIKNAFIIRKGEVRNLESSLISYILEVTFISKKFQSRNMFGNMIYRAQVYNNDQTRK